MRWRDLRKLLPKVAPAVRFANRRRMLAMDYGNAPAQPLQRAGSAPKDPSILERALHRQTSQLDRTQQLVKRMHVLSDRLLGGAPGAVAGGETSADPGSTIGRLESVQSMLDSSLERAFELLQRLEQL